MINTFIFERRYTEVDIVPGSSGIHGASPIAGTARSRGGHPPLCWHSCAAKSVSIERLATPVCAVFFSLFCVRRQCSGGGSSSPTSAGLSLALSTRYGRLGAQAVNALFPLSGTKGEQQRPGTFVPPFSCAWTQGLPGRRDCDMECANSQIPPWLTRLHVRAGFGGNRAFRTMTWKPGSGERVHGGCAWGADGGLGVGRRLQRSGRMVRKARSHHADPTTLSIPELPGSSGAIPALVTLLPVMSA